MWWYNILGDKKGIISHLLQLGTITAGYILLTIKIFAPKKENSDPILTSKITEWRRFIDYFGQSIEADQSRVGQKKIYFIHIGYIPRPSSVNLYMSMHHRNKEFNL